jgi:uncharacterized protein (DUF433 family)
MLGKPVIRGTRVTVELLLHQLSEGATEDSLLEAYPHLTREDIMAAIAYAAETVAQQKASDDNIATRARRKPLSALFKGPRGSTGQVIGESDEQSPGDSPKRSS